MNTKALIVGAVVVVVVGGGIWYATSHHAPAPVVTSATTTTQSETGTTASESGTGTIASLWGMTGNLTCDVSSNTGTPFSGKVYVSGGKVRADVNATIASMGNKQVESHMIHADGFVYSWTNLIPQGIKVPDAQATTGSNQSQGVSAATAITYSCLPWVADPTVFVVPTSVSFMTPPTSH